jgi:hypothetical protein
VSRQETLGVEEILPRHWATAIIATMDSEAREARRYMSQLEYLRWTGLGRDDAREALDVEIIETQALGAVRSWHEDGSPGALMLIGERGLGKGVAAAQWALLEREAGRSARWLSACHWGTLDRAGQAELLRRCEVALALIVDDVGAGASKGEWFKDKVQGLLEQRVADGRPSLVLANGLPEQLRAWVGDRMLDRLRIGGGMLRLQGKTLRRPRARVDEIGHGPRGQRAQAVLELIGAAETEKWCSQIYTDENGVWVEHGGHYERVIEVGKAMRVAVSIQGQRAIDVAASTLGLDLGAIRPLALSISKKDQTSELVHQLELAGARMQKAIAERREMARKANSGSRGGKSVAKRERGPLHSGAVIDVDIPQKLRGDDGLNKLQELGYKVHRPSQGRRMFTLRWKEGQPLGSDVAAGPLWELARLIAARDMGDCARSR